MICPACKAENAAHSEVCFTCGRSFSVLTQGSLLAGRYEILGLLGKGGMGMVYRAQDRMLDEVVAIKVLRREFVGTPAVAERFRSEIKLARKVSHPNVCRIHDYGEDAGLSYISMELLEGVELKRRLSENPAGLPQGEAFAAALQVARGLSAIHEVGVIHRDLKTPNVMQDSAGAVKLMDFGIAKDAEARGQTATGEVMGTPEYMSPEQCRGEKLDFRSDIYALGIVLYELFTGELPFQGENMMATLLKQVQEEPPFDGPTGSRVPRSLVPVLQKALAKARDQRFQNMGELLVALREAHRQADAAPLPAPAAEVLLVPQAPTRERRRQTRLEIHVNVFLCRLAADGAILHQERTVADNLSRRGARVMTSVPDLELGDRVVLKELGGDFATPAVVRHLFVGRDNIPRVGLEFVGQTAPDRLVLTESERVQTPRPGSAKPARVPIAEAGATSIPATPAIPAGGRPPDAERRRHRRLAISVDVVLQRLGSAGEAVPEERTVADNISRGGARVLTAMTGLEPGDKVAFKEVDGNFATEAVIRNVFVGPDRIPRLGLEFQGNKAPDRLVPPSDATGRLRRPATRPRVSPPTPPASPVPVPAAAPPPPSAPPPPGPDVEALRREILELHDTMGKKTHFEVLGIARNVGEKEVKKAYLALAKQYHPDAARDERLSDLGSQMQAIFVRLGQAYDVLRDVEKRGSYERFLGPAPRAPRAGGSDAAADVEAKEPAPPPPESDEQRHFRLESTLRDARKHIAEGQFWEAIQLLEPALEETERTRPSVTVRLLLGQALGKNPHWRKRAEEMLLEAVRDEPQNAEAHFQLGAVYRLAGLTQRARASMRKALELQPGRADARAELAEMDGEGESTRSRPRLGPTRKP